MIKRRRFECYTDDADLALQMQRIITQGLAADKTFGHGSITVFQIGNSIFILIIENQGTQGIGRTFDVYRFFRISFPDEITLNKFFENFGRSVFFVEHAIYS